MGCQVIRAILRGHILFPVIWKRTLTLGKVQLGRRDSWGVSNVQAELILQIYALRCDDEGAHAVTHVSQQLLESYGGLKLMRYTSHCKLQNNCVCLPKTRSNLGWQLGHHQEEKLGFLSQNHLASLLFLLHCNEHPEDCAAKLIHGQAQALAGCQCDNQPQAECWLCIYITWHYHSLASDLSSCLLWLTAGIAAFVSQCKSVR